MPPRMAAWDRSLAVAARLRGGFALLAQFLFVVGK